MSSFMLIDQSDNGKTLTIDFNPVISNYKKVYSESITQTLGSQYPFIRRNGRVNFRQFNIGGLISAASENNKDFCEGVVFGVSGTGYDQVNNEKIFRDAVIDFLHNGITKLFYSETEGEIYVQLTEITLTPEKQLGRLIYSFSAKATEVGPPEGSIV